MHFLHITTMCALIAHMFHLNCVNTKTMRVVLGTIIQLDYHNNLFVYKTCNVFQSTACVSQMILVKVLRCSSRWR